MDNNNRYKKTLKYFVIALILCIVFINSMIISIPDSHYKHTVMVAVLNTSAAIATALGFITVSRHGISGSHGKSYLFLTIGILLWFCADLHMMYFDFELNIDEDMHITYSHFEMGVNEDLDISISDALWLSGYLFLGLHLFSVIRSIGIKNLSKTISVISVVVVGFIIANLVGYYFLGNNYQTKDMTTHNGINLLITVLYPVLDLSLIIPSVIVLVNIYKEYQHSIAWILLSSSLLINAIADNGYTQDFVLGHPSSYPWDLFYISDFIIMTAALLWYNKFHISDIIHEKSIQNGRK
jgi:hypothetical protein